MTTIRTVVHDRRIEIAAPENLADGTVVFVELTLEKEALRAPGLDWDDTPEGVEAWIKEYDRLEPLVFTEAELTALEADRQQRKAWEKSQFDEYAEKLAKTWE